MKSTLFLPCAAGAEALLADEAMRIAGNAQAVRGGVVVRGDAVSAMRLNLESRLAQRVLWLVAEGPYAHEHDLYDLARGVRWSDWITPRQTLRVDSTAQRSPLRSLNFANLRIKDAVCDVLRESSGERPSVDTHQPDLPLALHLSPTHAQLYVDLSGEALFKRGWREAKGEAPLKETLAAALLAFAGWQGREADGPLLDPCCGAGTIAIEAAQLACGIAPGLQRRFAFERLLPFRDQLTAWRELQRAARERVHAPKAPVFAGDVSFRMTDFALRNAERAGVKQAIELKTADALQRMPPATQGTLLLNPPYGERIGAKGRGTGSREDFLNEAPYGAGRRSPQGGTGSWDGPASPGTGSSAQFFAQLATHWKRNYAGWSAWILSPDMKLPTLMRLKESRRVPVWNGPIECRLFRFDMQAGSLRRDSGGD